MCILLPVLRQHLLAAAAEALAVLLQAGEHDLIALAHLGAAEAADVARACIVLTRRLREGAGRAPGSPARSSLGLTS